MGCFSLLARTWFFGVVLLWLMLGAECGGSNAKTTEVLGRNPDYNPWTIWLIFFALVVVGVSGAFAFKFALDKLEKWLSDRINGSGPTGDSLPPDDKR